MSKTTYRGKYGKAVIKHYPGEHPSSRYCIEWDDYEGSWTYCYESTLRRAQMVAKILVTVKGRIERLLDREKLGEI